MVWITYEALVLFLSATLALILIAISIRYLHEPGALAFMGMMAGAFIWSLGYALELASHSFQLKLFWHNMQYMGQFGLCLAWHWFALVQCRKRHWINKRYFLPISMVMVMGAILIWTNEWHHLVRTETTLSSSGSLVMVHSTGTPLYFAFIAYAYILLFLSLFLFIQACFQTSYSPDKSRYLIYIASLLLPLATSLIAYSGLNPFNPFDPTPIVFVGGGLLIAFSVQTRTIGRARLIDHLQDGMIVTDSSGHITDLNQAAFKFLSPETPINQKNTLLGQPLAEWIKNWPDWIKAYATSLEVPQPLEIKREANQFYEVKISPLTNSNGKFIGHMAVIHDITRRKQIENSLIKQATTDYLTGIHNRRHFINLSEQQFQIASRYKKPISLIMIDIDYFKQINDTYGHMAGDIVLTQFVNICISLLRRADIFGRMGGEEFAVTLPETNLEGAATVAEKMRRAIEQSTFFIDGKRIQFTISVGVATKCEQDASFEALVQRADQLLYEAKEMRNCVRVQS